MTGRLQIVVVVLWGGIKAVPLDTMYCDHAMVVSIVIISREQKFWDIWWKEVISRTVPLYDIV